MSEYISDGQKNAVKAALESARKTVMSRVADANETTESEVIEIGKLLTEIVDVATGDKTDMQDSLNMLDGDDDSTVRSAIQRQTESVTGFVENVCSKLGTQVEAVGNAMELCTKVEQSISAIDAVTQKSQLMAWNISIEAARLGAQGSAVATIGASMGEFSEEIRDATKYITGLIEQLTSAIPALRESSAAVSSEASKFSEELATKLMDIESTVERLGERLRKGAEEADDRNQNVLQISQRTLSHLAFQDPVAQQLYRGENDLLQLSAVIGEILEYPIDSDMQEYATYCGADNVDQEQEAGVVDLF
ncbi:MAG: hypothetical protein Phyf2KO_11680 [Phycisphaerales bacterium]